MCIRDRDRAKNTYNKYLVVRKYVAEFIKYQYKRSDMSMNELTEEFILSLIHISSEYFFATGPMVFHSF